MSTTAAPTAPAAPTVDEVLARAAAARRAVARATDLERADWLDAISTALTAASDELVPIAHRESHLPLPRLTGEVVRTAFQAHLFAERLRDGSLFDTRIDHADPTWPMGARPDIRRGWRPIGPVLVFAASNFPFAFSVIGGDSVSALAAGCPVVVKAHEGHPELSRRVAALVIEALSTAGAPDGTFGLIEGQDAGIAAVQDRRIRAVGFTGSVHGGRALFDLAVSRPDPIPFYGELGSTNPVVVTRAAWASRADEIVAGFSASFTLGSGQFCTKPGIVFVPDAGAFIARVSDVTGPVGPMLTDRIRDGFGTSVAALAAESGVSVAWEGPADDEGIRPTLLQTSLDRVVADPALLERECFGPAALVVSYDDETSVVEAIGGLQGSLTGSVQAAGADDVAAPAIVEALSDVAGRVLWNDWPTGVTVSDAQQHGGPWPATTAPTTTSVGTAAAQRFARPVAYQNLPQGSLPQALRD